MMRAKVVTVIDEVICAGWGEPGGQWTEWGWREVCKRKQRIFTIHALEDLRVTSRIHIAATGSAPLLLVLII